MDEAEEMREIMEMQKVEIDKLKQALVGAGGATEVEQKYLEALRKAKAINVKYESERVKADKLANRILELEAASISNERTISTSPPSIVETTATITSPGKMKEKMNGLQKTNAELKRNVTTMKGELVKMKEMLKKETGLESLEATDDGWRGRAQKITLLQAKLKEMSRRDSGCIAPSDSASMVTGGTSSHGYSKDYDDVNRKAISDVSSARRVKEYELSEKCKTLQSQLSDATSKHTGHVARVTSLEAEVGNLKVNMARIIQKTENDDALVTAYKKELERCRNVAENSSELLLLERDEEDCMQSDGVDRGAYEDLLAKKDSIIDSLTSMVKRLESGITPPPTEYVLLLKSQLAADRDRIESLEQNLLRAKPDKKTPLSVPFDPTTLPPAVIEHISLLKGELSSLKERLHIMKANHNAELSVLTAELQAKADEEDDRETRQYGDDGMEQLQEEHDDLKAQYKELKLAFNKVMREQQQQ